MKGEDTDNNNYGKNKTEWTAFKKAQMRFRRRPDDPKDDLVLHEEDEEIVDFSSSRHDDRIERVHITLSSAARTASSSVPAEEHEPYMGPVYALRQFPGFLYAPQALSVKAQEELAYAAVSTYCEYPHSTNIGLVPPNSNEVVNTSGGRKEESMWNLWKEENGFAAATTTTTSAKQQQHQNNNNNQKKKYYKCFRKLSWATMGYNYDWTARTYHNHDQSPVPTDLETLGKRFAATSLLFLNSKSTTFTASACIVNYYNNKSVMGGHRDDSEYALDKPIVSFSMGRPAIFLLGGATRDDTTIAALLVRPGDVMLMSGATRLNYHAMARILSTTTSVGGSEEKNIHKIQSFECSGGSPRNNNQVPECEQEALRAFLALHRININLRQVYPDTTGAAADDDDDDDE